MAISRTSWTMRISFRSDPDPLEGETEKGTNLQKYYGFSLKKMTTRDFHLWWSLFISKKKGGTYFLWVNVISLRRDALL